MTRDNEDHAGLGIPLEMPVLAPPKKTVPDWLRAEMLKRGIGQNAQAGEWSTFSWIDSQVTPDS